MFISNNNLLGLLLIFGSFLDYASSKEMKIFKEVPDNEYCSRVWGQVKDINLQDIPFGSELVLFSDGYCRYEFISLTRHYNTRQIRDEEFRSIKLKRNTGESPRRQIGQSRFYVQ